MTREEAIEKYDAMPRKYRAIVTAFRLQQDVVALEDKKKIHQTAINKIDKHIGAILTLIKELD